MKAAAHPSHVLLTSRGGSAGLVGVVAEAEQPVRGQGGTVDDRSRGDHPGELGGCDLAGDHVRLGRLPLGRTSCQPSGHEDVEALTAEPVATVEVTQVAQLVGSQAGLFPELSSSQGGSGPGGRGGPRSLRELPRPPSDGVAVLLDQPQPALVAGMITAKSVLSTTPYSPTDPSPRRTTSSRTLIHAFRYTSRLLTCSISRP